MSFNNTNDEWFTSDSGRQSPALNSSYSANNYTSNNMSMNNTQDEDYDNEPPLLEELGIRFDHILLKTQAVINPTKVLNEHILDDADLAGPLVFCLMLGASLLFAGKVHFGYIYGFSVFGCLGLHTVINLFIQ